MRSDYCFEEKVDYLSLLDDIRRCDMINDATATQALLSNPLIDKYFNRMLGEDKKADSKLEKIVGVAAAKAAAKLTGAKEEDILKAANEAVEVLRDMRLKKLLQEGRITEAAYHFYKRAQKCAFIKSKVKVLWKKFSKKPLRWILKKALKYIPNPVVQGAQKVWAAGEAIWQIIPQPVKEMVKEAAVKVADKVVKQIPAVTKKLYEAGKSVVKKSAKIIEKGIEVAVKTGREVYENAKTVVKTVGQVGRTVLEGAGTIVRSVANCAKAVWSAPHRLFGKIFA